MSRHDVQLQRSRSTRREALIAASSLAAAVALGPAVAGASGASSAAGLAVEGRVLASLDDRIVIGDKVIRLSSRLRRHENAASDPAWTLGPGSYVFALLDPSPKDELFATDIWVNPGIFASARVLESDLSAIQLIEDDDRLVARASEVALLSPGLGQPLGALTSIPIGSQVVVLGTWLDGLTTVDACAIYNLATDG